MLSKYLPFVLFCSLTLAPVAAHSSSIDEHPQYFDPMTSYLTGEDTRDISSPFRSFSTSDNWLGGTGNWSNGADWSAGVPGSSSDVFINTGNDYVTLDTSATINSLTLGGTSGSSTLLAQVQGNYDFTIAGALTINQSGTLTMEDGTITVNADSTNAGNMNISSSFLTVNGSFTNSGSIQMSDPVQVSVNFTNSGTVGDIQNVTGILNVGGNVDNSGSVGIGHITVNGSLTNESGGSITASTLSVGGNLVNAGQVEPMTSNGTSAFTITGALINSGSLELAYASATVGSLNNSGSIDLGYLAVNGNAYNSGGISEYWTGNGSPNQSLVVNGTLTNASTGGIGFYGPYVGGSVGYLINSGTVDLQNRSSLSVSQNVTNSGTISTGTQAGGNTLSVNGELTNNAGGLLSVGGASDVANIGYISNAGTISIGNGASMNVNGGSHAAINALPGFLNTGTVTISQGGTLFSPLTYTQTNGQTTVDGTLRIGGRGIINFAGGSVYGNDGAIEGTTISNASFNIGDAPMTVGQFSIVGNYTQGANGSLTFDIASLSQYDQLNVSGRAQLNGLMTVNLLNGYIPQVGNPFDIMNFASESGTFSMVIGLPINGQEHFILEYNSTNLTLDVVQGQLARPTANGTYFVSEPYIAPGSAGSGFSLTASNYGTPSQTPEPGSFLLFGSGVLGLGYRIRRRMAKW